MTCDGYVNAFDLQCIFVNNFAGDFTIFAIIALLAVLALCAYFRMPNGAIGAGLVLFGSLFYESMPWLYYISIFGAGVIIFISVANLIKR